ncbi:MAG: glycosyltransferase family 39 protein [Actinobacteria bacterium]|nr:glycosyltransferase family 39 protein [Actinomycetota bacterium]MEA2503609.1 alpha,6-mannosyltransferase [Actinomycetota bacterium]MEA2565005.1 alpha,6-mannosyltransferase [Actinomycetota bacterium]
MSTGTGTQRSQPPAGSPGIQPAARTEVGRRLAELADRLPFARNWDARRAHIVLGVLWVATLGALLTRQGRAFPLLIVASAAFAFLLVMEARRPLLDPRLILWTSIVLIAVAVVIPPRESADVWSYAMYGRMVDHFHADPYKVSPLSFSGDPWFWRVSVWWQDTRTVYGPAFTAVSAVGMHLAGDSALRARLFFQLLTGASVVAALVLLYRRRVEPAALVFLGLSPVMVVSVVNGAHNDALVGLAALGAVVALSRRWRVVAGVALGLAALVKLIALLPAAAIIVWVWRREGRAAAAKLGAVIGAVVAVGYLLIGGLPALAPLQEASRLVDRFSLWGAFGQPKPVSPAGQGPLGGLLISPVPQQWLTGGIRYAAMLLLAGVATLVLFGGSSESRPSAGAGAVVLAFVLATSYIQPWYLAAVLPLVALQWRSRLAFLAAGYSVLLLLGNEWLTSGGLLKTVLRFPLSTAFPVFQLLALGALVALAVSQLRQEPLHLTVRPASSTGD